MTTRNLRGNAIVGHARRKAKSPEWCRLAGMVLREARAKDALQFVSRQEIADNWEGLSEHLGLKREFWRWYLDSSEEPPRDGYGASLDPTSWFWKSQGLPTITANALTGRRPEHLARNRVHAKAPSRQSANSREKGPCEDRRASRRAMWEVKGVLWLEARNSGSHGCLGWRPDFLSAALEIPPQGHDLAIP